jgi:hypothetical protein
MPPFMGGMNIPGTGRSSLLLPVKDMTSRLCMIHAIIYDRE